MTRLPLSHALIPETMRRLAYFGDWPSEVLDRLAPGAKIISVKKNDVLVKKGEALQHLYVLVSGMARLYLPLPNNVERVVGLVHPGDGMGEACLVLDQPCPFNAMACKDSHVMALDPMIYRQELGRNAILTSKTLERVSGRLMENLRDLEICSQRSSVQRVASYLMCHQPTPQTSTFRFQLPARKQDIAAKLGLTQETFSRVLRFLDKQGVIQMDGAQISIEDGSKLTEITSMREQKEPDQTVGF